MKSFIVLTVLTAAMTILPSLAQCEISNNQPVTRNLSADEVRIEGKIKLDYQQGLIDSDQLAQFQRDFDGILVEEDSLKSRGLEGRGRLATRTALNKFEAKLDSSAGVTTTAQANNKSGPEADANNAGLSKIEPTQ